MPERIIEYQVPNDVSGARADKVFASAFKDVSRARLQKAFELNQVSFDGLIIDKRFKIKKGGLLKAVLKESEATQAPSGVDIPLNIIHEDASIIVVNKAPGMVTHPGSGTSEDTLVHALLHYCDGKLSSVGAPDRPGIVHRLDKETSGLIVVAKTDLAYHELVKAFSERLTEKRYLALLSKAPKLKSGSCKDPIGRHSMQRTKMAVQSNGKEAHTDWKCLELFGSMASMVECQIHTGRTHQIRVHMSHLGFPLLGDSGYGYKTGRFSELSIPRVCLHAQFLTIPHPETGEKMTFEAPIPDDLVSLIESMRTAFG
jgi:23S rRNA pseudouridine1911/1915/1917 synthase